MELITSPAKKYVNSEATFKVKLPAYTTETLEGTYIDIQDTKDRGNILITFKGNTGGVSGTNKIITLGQDMIGHTFTINLGSIVLNAADKIYRDEVWYLNNSELTDQSLINQLEDIKRNFKTYEGETIIRQENDGAPFILSVLVER